MARGASKQEIEIKLALADPAHGRRLLRRAGFRVTRRRVFESNTVFDTEQRSLRQRGALLRLRVAGRGSILTYKGPVSPGRHKSRLELEAGVSDPEACQQILGEIGYHRVFRYEKYRTEYSSTHGEGVATLDETPIGTFLELEGPPDWIDATAKRLGFSEDHYITESYARLYEAHCRRKGATASDMIFRGASGTL